MQVFHYSQLFHRLRIRSLKLPKDTLYVSVHNRSQGCSNYRVLYSVETPIVRTHTPLLYNVYSRLGESIKCGGLSICG